MWHQQQRLSCEQSNVVDVTIQCQFNLAGKNVTELSTMFGTPSQPRHTTPESYNTTYTTGQPHTPARYRSACEYESQHHMYQQYTHHYNYQNTPTNYVQKGQQTSTPYNSQHVLRHHHVTQLDDSGYSSPSSQPPRHYSPRIAGSTSSPTLQSPSSDIPHTTDKPADVSQNVWSTNHCYYGYTQNQVRPGHVNTSTTDTTADDQCEDMKIAMREKDVTQRLFALRDANNDAVDEIEQYYQSQTSLIDVERHNILYQMAYDRTSTDSINKYYNRKLLSLLESVEQKLSASESDKKSVKNVKCTGVPPKKSRLLPKHAVKILESWYQENLENPYPSRDVTLSMASEGGITVEQIRKWFANKRNRSRNTKLKKGLLDGE